MKPTTTKTLGLMGSGMLFASSMACLTTSSRVGPQAAQAVSSDKAASGPAATLPVVVKNNCPFNLHVQLTGDKGVPLERDGAGKPLYRELAPKAAYTYQPPSHCPAGRVSAYKTLPSPTSPRELEKVDPRAVRRRVRLPLR